MSNPDREGELPARVLLSLGAVTGCALAFQVLLTRMLSAVLAYHFSFLAVSLSLVGTGAGALAVYLRPARFAGVAAPPALARWTALFGVALIVAPLCIARIDLVGTSAGGWAARFAATCLIAALPPFAAGVIVAVALSRFAGQIGAVYAADLAGAGIGALLAVPLMWAAPAPWLMVAMAVPAAVAARCFDATAMRGAIAVAGAALAVLAVATVRPVLHLSPGYEIRPDAFFVERWTPLARVIGVHAPGSDNFAMVLYDRVYAPVPIVRDGVDLTWQELQTGLQSVGYKFAGPGRALIIGGGGGRDIHTALSEAQSPVDVIELNDGIRRVVDEDLGFVSGRPYSLPGVHTAVGDGRSTLASRSTRYDQIHLGFTDTLSANAAQGFALMENNLYTVEAFAEYFDHLSPGGILNVSRLYDFVGEEVLRLAVLTLAALREYGVEEPRRHVFVMRGTELGGSRMGTVLARLEPFTPHDLHRLRFLAALRGGEVVFAPDAAAGEEWEALAAAASPEAFCSGYRLDVCPPTDDRPFFFNMDRLWTAEPLAWFWGGVSPYSILWITLGILVAFSLVAFALPLLLMRESAPSGAATFYFALIGVGYILVEIVLIQHFVLFLGFPTYALSVVLAGLLGFSGLGAWLSSRFSTGSELRRILAAAVVLIVVGSFALQPLLRALIGLPLAARVLVALALLAPLGLALGCAMPLGLRRLETLRRGGIAYAWGINGIASVMASVLGVVVALEMGFTAAGLAAASCYLGAMAVARDRAATGF
jgi:hypothetical protein